MTHLRDRCKNLPKKLKSVMLPIVIEDPGAEALLHLEREGVLESFLGEAEGVSGKNKAISIFSLVLF